MNKSDHGSDTAKNTLNYGIEDVPPPLPLMMYALQWWLVCLSFIAVMGVVVARMHSPDIAYQTAYIQRLFILMGAAMAVQAAAGHRLPLICGPATVLFVGLTTSSSSSSPAAQYTAIALGGVFMTVVGASGLLARLRTLFTLRVVAIVLLLVPFTLSPTILRLVLMEQAENWQTALQIALCTTLALFLVVINHKLPGNAKSLTLLLGLAIGTGAYFLAFGLPPLPSADSAGAGVALPGWALEFHAGTIIAFLLCFVGLGINEFGSIEAIGQMLEVKNLDGRLRKGMAFSGVSNILSGLLGTIGLVDFSLTAGIIAATGCASRFPFIPAGIGLIACAFSENAMLALVSIPDPVIGVLFFYMMIMQLAGALNTLSAGHGVVDFDSATIVAVPVIVGLVISFCPAPIIELFPGTLQPILGNGFIMGMAIALIMEHGVFRKKPETP